MDDENKVATEMLPLAKRTARRVMNDPEADSIAGWALLRAIRSYDSKRCDNLGAWVVYCVRIDVYHYLRKRVVRAFVELAPDTWWETQLTYDAELVVTTLTDLEWKLLIENYELKWPLDVVARRNQMTVYRLRQLLAEAARKLQEQV